MDKPTLDTFTRAYIEAALWSSNDESTPQGGEPLENNYGAEDIAEETLVQMVEDCRKFQAENAPLLRGCTRRSAYPIEAQAGHDFWLTRNGHGAGFWDGDWPETGGALTAASNKFGAVDLCVGTDGKVWAE
jgi:hypothetical protein